MPVVNTREKRVNKNSNNIDEKALVINKFSACEQTEKSEDINIDIDIVTYQK